MTKFELTMMCSSCKWKISNELEKNGFKNFDIDMDTSLLTFEEDVNPYTIIRIVNGIGYKIELVEDFDEVEDQIEY